MLTQETTLKLCKFLIQIGEEEKNLEVVRQILAEQATFEPYAAFSRLDRQRNGFLTVQNIQEFMINNGFKYDDKSCAYYIQHYDSNNDGKLSFEEFLNSVLPQENQALRTIVTQRKTYQVEPNEMLNYDVEYALARIFDREIQFFKKMDPYKVALKKCRDFTSKDAFYTIDLYNSQYIDFQKLGEFLIKHGYDLFEDQLIAIVRNIDQNDDGRIDLYEFIDSIEPKYELEMQNQNQKVFQDQDDPVTRYKNQTKTTQNFYTNNYGVGNPSEIFKQYIAPSQRTALSIQKHVNNYRTKDITQKKKLNQNEKQQLLLQQEKQQQKQDKLQTKIFEEELGEIARTFKLFISLDKEIETFKENLVSRQDFNILDAFRLFDVDGRGICSPTEFMNVLNAFGLYPTKYELYLILKRFDYDSDGKLTFQEFRQMLMPVKKEYEAMANNRAPQDKDLFFDVNELWSHETRQNFLNLFKIMLQNEAASESLRQRLNKRKHFNLKNLFTYGDQDLDGFWRVSDFKRIFDNTGILMQKSDLYYLIVRFDRNGNAKISYSEFINEIAPKSTQRF